MGCCTVCNVLLNKSCLFFPASKIDSHSMSAAFNEEHPEVKPFCILNCVLEIAHCVGRW